MTDIANPPPCPAQPAPAVSYENLQAHPLASQFDMIEVGEDGQATFESLKASIAKEGIHAKITLFEGKILDGRNRIRRQKS